MIVGCHYGNNNYTPQTFIDLKVQRTTRNINDSGLFLDTDNSDKIDTPDALPFPQLCRLKYRRLAATQLQLARPRGRGRPLGSKNKKETTTRRTEPSIPKNSSCKQPLA
jgi:hypothetical protein